MFANAEIRAERRAAVVHGTSAFVPSKSAQADLEPRHSAPKPAASPRGTDRWIQRARG